ncbi:elongation factor Tu family member [Theileria equi strain WA]|uniref:Elongation factor Tu family member n=1 Tax=Theileria equi strain WA TaxID=1537102 RepID=L0B2U4_THEEQ|nr:elongation factor Tu family member [Theileria equi strain WA]AFZ81414.1 elongation factor Tu family member [Theileria equi strain WA]|eukprot:XP_004831080.1 elongation factor Tu family member [Theileria equi strain WA]
MSDADGLSSDYKESDSSNTKSTFTFNPNAAEFKPNVSWYALDEPDQDKVSSVNDSLQSLSIKESQSSADSGQEAKPSKSDVTSDVGSSKKKSAESSLPPPDSRQHINIVFIGHIDAGKSTTCGNILYLSGQVDERTIEKYGREAKEKNRESWFLAFIMDTNEEERQKGKTIEVGRAKIETEHKRFTILDAPGHRNYVPNMIEGATQADCGVLIISARKGEFETGFERGGQTREHALLAKTLGVSYLIVAINKMDEPTCQWSEERYTTIVKKLKPFLKTCGFTEGKDLSFVPISGLTGQNILDHVSDPNYKNHEPKASWYDTSMPTLFRLLDELPTAKCDDNAPLRIPIIDSYRDNGIVCLGKVESGVLKSGQSCVLLPHKAKVKIPNVYFDDDEYAFAKLGENIRFRLIGIDDDSVPKGSVVCNAESLCPVVKEFTALISVVDLLEHRPLISAGYYCIFHAHCLSAEVEFVKLTESIDKATKKKKKNPVFAANNTIITAHLRLKTPGCLETFEFCPQLGRFTLRDEDKTIAIGKILEIVETE